MPGWELPMTLPSSNIQACGLKGAAVHSANRLLSMDNPYSVGCSRGEQHSSFMLEQWDPLRGAQEAQQLPPLHSAVWQWTAG